jgi:ArsR family transcriptional regulator, virulence genes transcriptional regulator
VSLADDKVMAALEAEAGTVAKILKMLANEKRLLILCRLAVAGEMPVAALASDVSLSQSALSQHLARMREQGLVAFRRESQTLHYSIADPQTDRLLLALKEIYCPKLAS